MWTDLAEWIISHFLLLFFLALAGFCFLLAGLIAVFVVRRRDLSIETEVPVYVVPPPPVISRPVQHHAAPEETRVLVRPGIPGALPPAEVVEHTEDVTQALTPVHGLRDAIRDRPASEVLQRLSTLRGPLCSTCGGPFGNCSCYSQKSGSDKGSEPTQVVDLCALTTQDIETPAEDSPIYRGMRDEKRWEHLGTSDLTVRLDQIKERAA